MLLTTISLTVKARNLTFPSCLEDIYISSIWQIYYNLNYNSYEMSLPYLLEMLSEAAVNVKRARNRQLNKVTREITKVKGGNLLLWRSHKKQTPWDAKYISHFQICRVINDV